VVDTTCGSVLSVWKRVTRYAQKGFTSIIHGKYYHEETKATASQTYRTAATGSTSSSATSRRPATSRTLSWAGWTPDELRERLGHGMCPGFDPDEDLERVGSPTRPPC
jgi:4-hydroxy-3-methylbut-2-enyl diphosphate reductase